MVLTWLVANMVPAALSTNDWSFDRFLVFILVAEVTRRRVYVNAMSTFRTSFRVSHFTRIFLRVERVYIRLPKAPHCIAYHFDMLSSIPLKRTLPNPSPNPSTLSTDPESKMSSYALLDEKFVIDWAYAFNKLFAVFKQLVITLEPLEPR
jgi:hypothetical protein